MPTIKAKEKPCNASPPKQKIEQKFEKSLEKESAQMHTETKGDCCKVD